MASFTTTCAISGTVWDGPSGCPIISPSNWQTYVLDNLTVLANHDHSGSTGEGQNIIPASYFPALDNDQFTGFFPSASSSGWVLEKADIDSGSRTAPFGFIMATSSQGASIAYDIYLRPGTYDIFLAGIQGPCCGKITGCIGGVEKALWNFYYSVGSTWNYSDSLANKTFSTSLNPGEKQLVLTNDVKDSSSSGYMVKFSCISITRTGS